ncbi:MAG: hypothetical protein NZL87_05415 [Thermomicrobium sp.]|nr:hypothetical protein [Thermomicrobium sp.]
MRIPFDEDSFKISSIVTGLGGLTALVGAIILLVQGLEVPNTLWFIAIGGLGLGGLLWPTGYRR